MAMQEEKKSTAVVFDKKLESHFSIWNKDFTERPQRVIEILERCRQLNLLERCLRIPVREATQEEMLTCHSQDHLDLLESTSTMSETELKEISQKYDFIYFHKNSAENAKLSLGGVIDLVDAIVSEKVRNGMAIVRPPGHHAMKDEYCGYCYLANVAIASKLMIEKYNLSRILIFDWDVHHGQGSQFIFYDDPRVMYVSIHRYEHGLEWPNLREGDYDFTGDGPGKGFNINIPLNEIGCDNSDYLAIMFNLLLPIFYQFNPELVLVSAGYDCAIGCPEGEMAVTPACFAHFVNFLKPLAGGKLALILEGGYNMKSLAESAALSLRALLGDPTPVITPISTPRHSVTESVLNCIKMLHRHWSCLQYQDFVEGWKVKAESYPFQGVLHLPPVKDVIFFTSQNRPEIFPLIQECADKESLQQQTDLNKRIIQLIETTPLVEAKHRWGLAYMAENSPLLHHLKESQLWSKCLPLQSSSSSHLTASGCIKTSLDCILSNQVHCCVCLLQSKSQSLPVNGSQLSNGSGSPTEPNLVNSLTHHASSSQIVNRILIIDLYPESSTQHIKKDSENILYISLGSSSPVDEDLVGSSRLINIPIPQQESGSDTDIISVFLQIILPMAYQFSPHLVVAQLYSQNHCKSVNISKACFGHVTQMLQGLAGGKLLLLVEEEQLKVLSRNNGNCDKSTHDDKEREEPARAEVESETSSALSTEVSHLLGECLSVTLGASCKSVPTHQVSESIVTTIKTLQDRLKGYWSSFQFRGKI